MHWQPAALTEELAGERPVKALTLMGEDLILYRYGDNEYGLIGRHCPHRGADLCFGRLEDGGLRCAFHGWLFDHTGKCLEQPAEPANSNFYKKIKHRRIRASNATVSSSPIWAPATPCPSGV